MRWGRMLWWCAAGLAAVFLPVKASAVEVSEATQECLDCHATYTPGIVEDWRVSGHALITPAEAQQKPALERRVSSEAIPEELLAVAVGCYECHAGTQP